MKNDLDRLMQERGLDGLLVTGPAMNNPYMTYFTGLVHVSGADLVKKRGEPPVLFAHSMEREEALHTGLQTRSLDDYRLDLLLKETQGDHARAIALRYRQMLQDLGLTRGRLGLFGLSDAGEAYAVFSELNRLVPGLELQGDPGNPLLLEAMSTKDEQELEQIRCMGQTTLEVVANTADFLSSHRAKDDILVRQDGEPLTIREVKDRINLWLAERGAEASEGTIFAIGRDAAIPHSAGNPADLLRLGQTIVFDIYPRQAGGGYFYDFTRTWCLGYATDEAQALYEDVRFVFNTLRGSLRLGARCKDYQTLACELFEARGHPTIKDDPNTEQGYVHGLGHGVGLYVHERPTFSTYQAIEDTFQPGMVFTLEPGLYYPQRGLGVRLEDTLAVQPDGNFAVLAEYPYDLVLPVRNSR